jgi:uncharacterized protein (DUF1330 family)
MSAFVIGLINETCLNDEIRAYLEKIDATLQPYAGRFVIHGGPYLCMEGGLAGDLIAIEFPDLELALRWYQSPAYRTINRSGRQILLEQSFSSTACRQTTVLRTSLPNRCLNEVQ